MQNMKALCKNVIKTLKNRKKILKLYCVANTKEFSHNIHLGHKR